MDKSKLYKLTKYYLEGKLSDENEKILLDWIKANEDNQRLFLNEQKLLSRAIVNRKHKTIDFKWQSLINRMEPFTKQNNTRKLILKVASIAAAFILGIIATTIVIPKLNPSSNQSVQKQNITVPFGAKTNIELPDGSFVWLNSGSTLSFPSEFGNNRLVSLIGEAFFEVEKNEIPFIVSTSYGEVEVKGTSFNVKAFNEDILQATLVTGSVLVREKENNKEFTLRPGQQANLTNGKIRISDVETDIFTSWKEGKLIFRKEYLPTMVKRLERWYNVKIELDKDSRLNDIWFSGTLEMESFTEVLELLKVTSSIDYTYNEKTRLIKITYNKTNYQ